MRSKVVFDHRIANDLSTGPQRRRHQLRYIHTSGENIVDNGDLGLDRLGMIRGQEGSLCSPSQDPPRVILCSAQRYAHRQIVSDGAKDTFVHNIHTSYDYDHEIHKVKRV
jgi:hypothetical protein